MDDIFAHAAEQAPEQRMRDPLPQGCIAQYEHGFGPQPLGSNIALPTRLLAMTRPNPLSERRNVALGGFQEHLNNPQGWFRQWLPDNKVRLPPAASKFWLGFLARDPRKLAGRRRALANPQNVCPPLTEWHT